MVVDHHLAPFVWCRMILSVDLQIDRHIAKPLLNVQRGAGRLLLYPHSDGSRGRQVDSHCDNYNDDDVSLI